MHSDLQAQWMSCQPVLESYIEVTQVRARGQRWWVLCNGFTGKYIRLNEKAWGIVSRMNGHVTLATLISSEKPQELADVMSLLYRLQQFGALGQMPQLPGGSSTMPRTAQDAAQPSTPWQWLLRALANPMGVRIPLLDPDRWLARVTSTLDGCSGRIVLVLWLLAMLVMVVLGFEHSELITAEFAQLPQRGDYWLMFWLAYPLMKGIHEVSHGVMLKRHDLPVHEAGVTFLVFTPIPYVDATAAWSLARRSERILVSAIGMMTELLLAAVALLLFVLTEPGLVHDLSFVVFTIGTVSSLLFNANPLLKFDAYYMLQDWLEIPNLYFRARRYLLYLGQRYLFRVKTARSPAYVSDERHWLLFYGVSALIYRYFVLVVIAFWLLDTLPLLGLVLCGYLLVDALIKPMIHLTRYLRQSPDLAGRRRLTSMGVLGTFAGVLALTLWMPVGSTTRVQGVVWVPAQAEVFSLVGGEVASVLVEPGEAVREGEVLLRLSNPNLQTDYRRILAEIRAGEQQMWAATANSRTERVMAEQTLEDLAQRRADIEQQLSLLEVKAGTDGVFHTEDTLSLQGRYFEKGELVGYVVDASDLIAKVVIPEQKITDVENSVLAVTVRLAERFDQEIPAQIERLVPGANRSIPSMALADTAGGGIPIAQSEGQQMTTRSPVFHLELRLPTDVPIAGLGERVYASLQHPAAPLAGRLLDATRRLFLKRLTGQGLLHAT